MDTELQGRIYQDVSAATKDVSVAEPTMFDDEEVTMTMAQTLIKLKAEKAKILDEQIAKRLHDEEVRKATARDKQEKDDLERAQVLQKQYDDKEENIDWNVFAEQIQERHLENIMKCQSLKRKPVSIAQARKNMIIYLKNMAGVGGITEAYQSFEDMLKGFNREDLVALSSLVKEKFISAVPNKLYTNCGVHQVSSTTKRHDMFMLTEKDYSLSNGVMTMMLSAKSQVKEDSDMARDLVMKIFMEANKPKSRSKDDSAAEVTEEITLSG
nr:hypothetical protein [Tanacetum cinerariifolium]